MSVIPTHPLGAEVSQHRYQLSHVLFYFVGAGLCLLLWFGLIGIGISEVVSKGDWGALAGTTCLGSVFGLPGVWLGFSGIRSLLRAGVVTVYEGGVALRTRFSETAFPFDEVRGLTINTVSKPGAQRSYCSVTLFKEGKDKLAFDESEYGRIPDATLTHLREQTLNRLLPEADQALQQGGSYTLGPVRLTNSEITLGKKTFALSDLEGWRFQQTNLVVFPKGGRPARAHVHGQANTHVLAQLLARRVAFTPDR